MKKTTKQQEILDSKEPLVSCIIPTKNRPEKAIKAIFSALEQTHKNMEVIVIDDCSIPPFELPPELKTDSRILLLRTTQPAGGAKARNIGIKNSSGDYFCFLDDDDIYLPNKTKDLLQILEKNPDIDAAIGECIIRDMSNGKDSLTPQKKFSPRSNTIKNRVHTNSTLIRSSLKSKLSFNEKLEKFQDTQFNTDLCFKFKVKYTPKAVAVWNVNWSESQITSIKTPFRNTKNYFKLIHHFIIRTKTPPYLLFWHIYKLTSFTLRSK